MALSRLFLRTKVTFHPVFEKKILTNIQAIRERQICPNAATVWRSLRTALNRVVKISELQGAPYLAKSSTKKRTLKIFQKEPQFWLKAHIF